jgi:RNA polymerase sigma-70 factor (ECF subfamily)
MAEDEELRELLAHCQHGDQRAMATVVTRFQDQVFGLCYRMLGQRQDAEDVTQETFVRALRNLHQWDAERDFTPWLLTIAGNRCRTWLATRRRRPTVSAEVELLADPAPDRHAAQQTSEEVLRAVAQLRDEYRQAFLLFHESQLSYVEIAEALDCPLGTVRTWVHRARRELADRLRRRGFVAESREGDGHGMH